MLLRVAPLLMATTVFAACSGGTESDPVGDACEDYCALVIRNCPTGVAQYPDISTCLATCETMEVGEPGATQGNTIACRTFWAAISEGDPDQCQAAGPGGNGVCGNNCDSFCATTQALCEDQPFPPYESLADCQATCATYDATEVFDTSDLTGNTLACRIYHMTAASTDQQTHCQHTSLNSDMCD